jgi:hypothetical protein
MSLVYRHATPWTVQAKEQAEGGGTMCCQDGDAAIWHVFYKTAGWPAEAGGSFLGLGRWASEELPTSAAELEIQVVAFRSGEAVEDTAPPGGPHGAALWHSSGGLPARHCSRSASERWPPRGGHLCLIFQPSALMRGAAGGGRPASWAQLSVMRTDRLSAAGPASRTPDAFRSGVNWGKLLPTPVVEICAGGAPRAISSARTRSARSLDSSI